MNDIGGQKRNFKSVAAVRADWNRGASFSCGSAWAQVGEPPVDDEVYDVMKEVRQMLTKASSRLASLVGETRKEHKVLSNKLRELELSIDNTRQELFKLEK